MAGPCQRPSSDWTISALPLALPLCLPLPLLLPLPGALLAESSDPRPRCCHVARQEPAPCGCGCQDDALLLPAPIRQALLCQPPSGAPASSHSHALQDGALPPIHEPAWAPTPALSSPLPQPSSSLTGSASGRSGDARSHGSEGAREGCEDESLSRKSPSSRGRFGARAIEIPQVTMGAGRTLLLLFAR